MKKAIRIIVYVLIAGIILLLGVQVWLGNKIKKIVQEQVYEQTEGRSKIDIGNINVRLIGRTVCFRDIRITTDTAQHPTNFIDARIKEFTLKGIHYHKQDSLVSIRARMFSLDGPDINILSPAPTHSSDSRQKTLASSKSVQLEIGKLSITSENIRYGTYRDKDTTFYTLKNFYGQIDKGKIVSKPDAQHPFFSCQDVRVSFSSFRNLFAEKSQLLEVDSLDLRSKEEIFSVNAIRLLPQYSEQEFAIKSPQHTDWTKIETGKIICHRFNVLNILEDRFLKIDSIEIQRAKINSFKNRQVEQTKRIKRLFYESVQQFPYSLEIRKIALNHIDVEYQELSENGISPGTVTFNDLNGTFSGLTNVVSPEHPYYTLQAEGKLMDQGRIRATFRLPVDSLHPHFEVKGHLGKMNLQAINPMTEPLVNIKITSGEVKEMEFTINGNSQKAKVNMLFLYNDLKVRIVKEKDGHLKTRSFLTNIVNGILLDADNPDRKGTRKVEETAERDIYRSQFNYLWRTLLSGLKKSIGI